MYVNWISQESGKFNDGDSDAESKTSDAKRPENDEYNVDSSVSDTEIPVDKSPPKKMKKSKKYSKKSEKIDMKGTHSKKKSRKSKKYDKSNSSERERSLSKVCLEKLILSIKNRKFYHQLLRIDNLWTVARVVIVTEKNTKIINLLFS